MAQPAKRRATYEDLCALPENVIGEIIHGVLHVQPRPAAPHALASTSLGAELFGAFHRGRGGPGGWVILHEPELHLHGDILVPDLGGWRRERMPEVPQASAFELSPDWVCEVLSPSSAATDRAEKVPIYAREKVVHVWLVDPSTRTLEVYRLGSDGYVVVGTWRDDARVRAEPFDAIELELEALWRR